MEEEEREEEEQEEKEREEEEVEQEEEEQEGKLSQLLFLPSQAPRSVVRYVCISMAPELLRTLRGRIRTA